MKYLAQTYLLTALLFSIFSFSQENKTDREQTQLFSYELKAKEDADYEHSIFFNNVEDEKDFWNDQKRYEKDLRKYDKEAYNAYMKGKSNAYAAHAEHCGQYCHHSDQYYRHAHLYYSYSEYHPTRKRMVGLTGVRIASPRIGFSIF